MGRLRKVLFLVVSLCPFHAYAAISRQYKVGGADSQTSPMSTGNLGSSVTSGDPLVVIARASTGTTIGTPTDTLSTSWTAGPTGSASGCLIQSWYGFAPSSGTESASVTLSGTDFAWIVIIDVTGMTSPTIDVSQHDTGTGITDMVTGTFSTTSANEYIVVAAVQNAFATYSAGTDFTLIANVPTNPDNFGGIEDYIPSMALSSYVAHMTSSGGITYDTATLAFKGTAGGGGSASSLGLRGVGR